MLPFKITQPTLMLDGIIPPPCVGKAINKINTMKYNKMPPTANYGY